MLFQSDSTPPRYLYLGNNAAATRLCFGNTYLSPLLHCKLVFFIYLYFTPYDSGSIIPPVSMADSIPEYPGISLLEHEIARLRQNIAELEARLRKPRLQQHLEELLKDYPRLSAVE
jgi:hypothetical protein